jgi:hypothetical protein
MVAAGMAAGISGCARQVPPPAATTPAPTATTPVAIEVQDQVVDAACGTCQFAMNGSGCELAVRIDGKSYFVDGSKLDDHGDAHSAQGMCVVSRKAKVTGKVDNGRFVATQFELLPWDAASDAKAVPPAGAPAESKS